MKGYPVKLVSVLSVLTVRKRTIFVPSNSDYLFTNSKYRKLVAIESMDGGTKQGS
jgi:hypothetical protein